MSQPSQLGLNARRFTLPESSEPNILKVRRSNKGPGDKYSARGDHRRAEVKTINEPTATSTDSWSKSLRHLWSSIVTVLWKLVYHHRITFLLTLPLVMAYLIRIYFPSVRMPKKIIRVLCTTMGIICSCALPDLFTPLSAINCNADYYHSLCGSHEFVMVEAVSTTCNIPAVTMTSAQLPPPLPATTSITAMTTIASVAQTEEALDVAAELIPLTSHSDIHPVNFGLANNGAQVLPALTSPTEGLGSSSYLAGLISVIRGYDETQMDINPPLVVLEEMSESACWKFMGPKGHIAVSLSDTIIWKYFTIHFPQHIHATDVKLTQAPKVIIMRALVLKANVEVEARRFLTDWERFVVVEQLLDSSVLNSSFAFMEVARVVYKPSEGSRQMFKIHSPVRTSIILVEILDNWGNNSTCLHKLSFHGELDIL